MTNMHAIITGKKDTPLDDMILAFLNLTKDDFNRFRDVWLDMDKKEIEVYTRCGGGNREYNEAVFERMKKHTLYIRDEDDELVCTYCSFYFQFPKTEEFLNFLQLIGK